LTERLAHVGPPKSASRPGTTARHAWLAFGSPEEAELRFGHLLQNICRWEKTSLSKPSPIEPSVELLEVGRFRLTRRGRHVRLDVAVDTREFRELLRVWGQHNAWDWGGD